MSRLLVKSAVARRTHGLLNHFPKALKRSQSTEQDYVAAPPVIANSFPKSGTNLLIQILAALPDINNYGTLWTQIPSYNYVAHPTATMLKMIQGTVPGEAVVAHLFHEPEFLPALADKHAIPYFIYRDLRDVVVSEAFYISDMNHWHRLHRYYQSFDSLEEKIKFAILGDRYIKMPFSYPDIAQRFQPYLDWISNESVFSVRFEDLIGPDRQTTISAMMEFYVQQSGKKLDIEALSNQATQAISPSRSHTFREGKVAGWKNYLNDEHIALMKETAGDLLFQLGYDVN